MRALILGGGATLGAFSAGALEALEERKWSPEILIGSSAGGINLLRSFVGGARAAIEFWSALDWRVLLREALRARDGGLLAAEAFRRRVEADVSFEALSRDPRLMGFMVVDLESGAVDVRSNRTEDTPERLRQVSRAAYALPPLFAPVADGDRLLADGGLLYNAPLTAAARLGATEIVYLCNVQALPHAAPQQGGLLRSTGRYLDIFFRRASNVGFVDQEISEHLWRGIPLLVIAPPATHGVSPILRYMVPSKRGLVTLIDAGKKHASEALDHFERSGPGLSGREIAASPRHEAS